MPRARAIPDPDWQPLRGVKLICDRCSLAFASTGDTTCAVCLAKRTVYIRATHCGKGHEFTVQNTYIRPNGFRMCRICQAAHYERAHVKRKEKANV